ncbi:MAG: FliO/MopB family protein [Planctomycetaceae bacterium]|nr:FliO/MopB family protein [Planctomycetaceae bacterium]
MPQELGSVVTAPQGLVAVLILVVATGVVRGQDDRDPFRSQAPQRMTVDSSSARPLPARPEGLTSRQPREASTPVSMGTLWPTLVTCGLFLVVFGGCSWWIRRHGPARLRPLPGEVLEVLGRRSLEPRVNLHLVRCGQRILVLGAGPDGVRTLSEITDPVEVDLLSGACLRKPEGGETPGEFAMSLRRSVLGTRGATAEARSGRPERAA